MQSLRALGRTAPRAISRITSSSVRTAPRSSLLQPAWRQPTLFRATAAFSTSRILKDESPVTDELVAKLESEIRMEKDVKDSDTYSGSIKDYLENSQFEIEDKAGHEEVILRRKMGDESIEVTFTIADLTNMEDPEEVDERMYDEDTEGLETAQSGGANTKGAINAGRKADGNFKIAPEDSLEEESAEGAGEGETSFPVRLRVKVTRDGRKEALVIEAVAESGDLMIENVYVFPEAELADAKTAELDWKRRGLYTGPPFGNLDEDLQILLERYLEDRGVNTGMAMFVPDYIDFKEQKEYLRWLNDLKSFVD